MEDDIEQLDAIIADVLETGEGRIVWDVDGTLFDPQSRMVATAEAFMGAAVKPHTIGRTWESAADALNVDRGKFHAFWHHHFWEPRHFQIDLPIPVTIARARQVPPAHNVILTGRHPYFDAVTRQQLSFVGVHSNTLWTKPLCADTAAFKAEVLLQMDHTGEPARAFVSDCPRELNAVAHVAQHYGIPVPACFYCVPHHDVKSARAAVRSGLALVGIAGGTV